MYVCMYVCMYVYGHLFSRATNFANGLKREVRGSYFHESTSVSPLHFAIHVTIEFPLIFDETNFVEVPKIHKIFSPQKRHPTVLYSIRTCYMYSVQCGNIKNLTLASMHCILLIIHSEVLLSHVFTFILKKTFAVTSFYELSYSIVFTYKNLPENIHSCKTIHKKYETFSTQIISNIRYIESYTW